MIKIEAFVSAMRSNRAGDRSQTVSISADYEAANILSSITYWTDIKDAQNYFVGQKLIITIEQEVK